MTSCALVCHSHGVAAIGNTAIACRSPRSTWSKGRNKHCHFCIHVKNQSTLLPFCTSIRCSTHQTAVTTKNSHKNTIWTYHNGAGRVFSTGLIHMANRMGALRRLCVLDCKIKFFPKTKYKTSKWRFGIYFSGCVVASRDYEDKQKKNTNKTPNCDGRSPLAPPPRTRK